MAVSNISSGSDCGVNPKAEVQSRCGDVRPERVAGQSVELNGNIYQPKGVSSHSEPDRRTADKNKSQDKGRRVSKRRFHFSSSLTADMRSLLSPSLSAGISCYHDNERVPDVHDRIHDRKGNLKQITGTNRNVITEYIEGKKEARDVIKLTIREINSSPTLAKAWEAVTNVYHLIPDDKISCFKKDPGSVNAFLRKLYENCCSMSGLCEFAKLTLELLVNKGVTCNISIHSYFMKIYKEVRDIEGAECLLKRDNVVSGNPEDWLGGDFHIGIIKKYLQLCLQIKRYQEARTLVDALIKLTDREEPLRLIKNDSQNSPLVVVILEYCSAVGDFELAKKIFNPKNHYCRKWNALRNQYVYNSFLNLCLELEEYDEAGSIVNLLMLDKNTEDMLPDPVTVITMLKYCIFFKDYDLARRLIFGTTRQQSYISKWEIQPNAIIYDGYMRVCLGAGKFDDIEPVISELDKYARDKNGDPSQRPAKESCHTILEYCLETKNLSLVKRLLFGADGQDSLIRQWNIPYSILFFNLYLRICTNAGEYQQAEQAIKEFINRAKHPLYKYLDPDRYTASAILKFCKAAGNVDFVKKIVFSGEADRGCVDLRDVKIDSICLADYISTCAELRMFKQAWEIIGKIIKSAERRRPYLNVPPDVIIVVAILKYCVRADNTDLAELMVFGNEKQQSYLSKWEIAPNFEIYAHWALVYKNNFAQTLNKLIKKRICVNELGYSDGVFNTHIDRVFENKYCVDDNGKKFFRPPGLPFEFAEALFEYHYRGRGRNIKQVITGYHGTGKLSEKFTDVLQTKFKLEIEVSPDGGCIEFKKTESETVKPED